MKNRNKTLAIALALALQLCTNPCKAQGNTLQFSRVILVGASTQTVPANTVWKIETVCISDSVVPAANGYTNYMIKINGAHLLVGRTFFPVATVAAPFSYSASNSTGYSSWINWSGTTNLPVGSPLTTVNTTMFPIWLPAATTLVASTNVTYISVIEFNIVP